MSGQGATGPRPRPPLWSQREENIRLSQRRRRKAPEVTPRGRPTTGRGGPRQPDHAGRRRDSAELGPSASSRALPRPPAPGEPADPDSPTCTEELGANSPRKGNRSRDRVPPASIGISPAQPSRFKG